MSHGFPRWIRSTPDEEVRERSLRGLCSSLSLPTTAAVPFTGPVQTSADNSPGHTDDCAESGLSRRNGT